MKRKDKKESFRFKVLRSFRVAIFIGLTGAFIGLSLLEYKLDSRALIADINVLGKIVGNRSVAALIFNDPDTARNNLSSAEFHDAIDMICLYAKDGSLFADYHAGVGMPCQAMPVAGMREADMLDDSIFNFSIVNRIFDRDEVLGYIAIHGNKASVFESMRDFWLIIMVAFVGVWLIMEYVAKRALRRIMLPLEELNATTRDIAFHKLQDTRAVKLSNDEIGDLVEVFNQMLDSIAEENRAVVESESRFRTLTKDSPVGIFQRDMNGALIYANDKWYEITGLTEAGDDKFFTNILDTYRRQYEKFMLGLDDASGTRILEFGYRNPVSGQIQSFMKYVSPLRDANGVLQGFIGSLLDVTELKNAQLELEKLAFHDPLTGLPNRRFFRDHLNFILADAKRSTSRIAIMMLDLDNFKKVNDTLGHDTGDNLLAIISQRLQSVMSESHLLSRMGGDEFLFLITDTNIDDAAIIGQSILDAVNEPVEIRDHVLDISGSIGVAMFPEDGITSHDLIKNADMALYNAKDNGRGMVSFYSKELDKHIKENLRLESKLIKAVNGELLDIYLQPLYSTAQKRIFWGEALLRWNDRVEGYIEPARFIPLAESIGIIHKLGRYVMTQVCQQLSTNRQYLQLAGIGGISINLSAMEFYSRNFLPEVSAVLRETGVDTTQLEFEITESTVMNDIDTAVDIMQRLRDLGCRLSIDDFGTGYSSLSYLKRFPITALKIDKSFVADIPYDISDVEICTAIIAMAHKLGLAVVAEGVETEEQRNFLASQGCEFLQGYYFARPEAIHEFVKRGRKGAIKIVK